MSDTPAEAPATDPPGDKVYICPACGLRYDVPTTCANGHEPTQTVEYDRATVEAADAGDAAAQTAIGEQAVAAAGTTAGIATQSAEAIPPESVPPPVAAEPVPGQVPAAAATTAPAAAPAGDVGSIFADFEAAVAAAVSNAKSALGL